MVNVRGYPTLLYFLVANQDDPDTVGYYDYNGKRTIEALEDGWKYGRHRRFPQAESTTAEVAEHVR